MSPTRPSTAHRPRSVVILAPAGMSAFHLSVPLAIFGMCFEGSGMFDVRVATEAGNDAMLTRHVSVHPDGGPELLDVADVVIVAGWGALDRPPSALLMDGLRAAHTRGAYVVGLCYGAYGLAHAGLLDGRRASTHWMAEADFQTRFPAVQLDVNALYVDDARLVTSAGTGAGLDCCLYLVRTLCGAREANRVARAMVLPPHREGGQAQYIEQPVAVSTHHAKLSRLLDHIREHLADALSIDSLAARVAMSRRSFTRHFANATGMTVSAWILRERLRRAKDLLETTSLSIDAIAQACGFNSEVGFRQAFGKAMQVSPRDWRRTFKAD